jgi:putative oxidoreductase
MQLPELKLVVEEKRTAMDLFVTWVPRIAVALAFPFIGLTKFPNNPDGTWFKTFEEIGFGQWFRYFTGAMQVVGALLLLTRWTLTVGAAMLACTMIGAALVDIFVQRAVGYALVPLLLLGAIVAVWISGPFGAGSATTV